MVWGFRVSVVAQDRITFCYAQIECVFHVPEAHSEHSVLDFQKPYVTSLKPQTLKSKHPKP